MQIIHTCCCGLDVHKKLARRLLDVHRCSRTTPEADFYIQYYDTRYSDALRLARLPPDVHTSLWNQLVSTENLSTTRWKVCLSFLLSTRSTLSGRKTDVRARRMDRRPVAAWFAARKFCHLNISTRVTRFESLSHHFSSRTHANR